ncbi:DUF4174 domain-containing protein [Rhizobium lemnae]|uniref:DUF4174 domain-containing protein n=1 Tax=Rhizobium lemnae TaxID=1214924 RepID=A0ABV8E867_9HYPH|nr:DUF4174 domain-containing protein [Rhizobium lemnae]MCJ8507008.1 DUF4174 domain-containing protein [Rhizobium lemnae]
MSCTLNGIVAAITVLGSATIAHSAVDQLDQFRWNHRIVVVFADRSDEANYVQQMASLRDAQEALAERDMLIISVVSDVAAIIDKPQLKLDADSLRKRFGAKGRGFRAVLIGKDGGAKLSSNRPITPAELFSTIDAMPMRQSEMR